MDGSAPASPNAVSIRHRMYEAGGTGRNGNRRYHALPLNAHAAPSMAGMTRGRRSANASMRE